MTERLAVISSEGAWPEQAARAVAELPALFARVQGVVTSPDRTPVQNAAIGLARLAGRHVVLVMAPIEVVVAEADRVVACWDGTHDEVYEALRSAAQMGMPAVVQLPTKTVTTAGREELLDLLWRAVPPRLLAV